MQSPGTDLTYYGTVPGAPPSDKTFFWSSPVFGRKISQKSQSALGPTQCISGPGNNLVGRRNYLLYIFQLQFTFTSPVVMQQNTFEKKLAAVR